jgi:hypothetical protein
VDGGSVHQHAVPRAGRRRPASRARSGRTADRSPRAFRPAAVRAPMARAGPVRDPGTRASLPGYRKDLLSTSGRFRSAGPASPHTSAPPWRVRALQGSRRWVEARTVVRRSRSAAGGAPSEMSQGGRCRPAGCGWLGDRVVGRGHPGKRATARGVLGAFAEDVVQRLAAVGALTAGGCIDPVLKGTSSRRSPGTGIVAPAGATP